MTMRERLELAVYKAISAQCAAVVPTMFVPSDTKRDESKINCQPIVDAVLDALMKPTDGMNDAGSDIVDAHTLAETGFCGPIFIAMIRAAKDGK